jgi:hypothetical protein
MTAAPNTSGAFALSSVRILPTTDVQQIVLDCYTKTVNCFFGLSSQPTKHSLSALQTPITYRADGQTDRHDKANSRFQQLVTE